MIEPAWKTRLRDLLTKQGLTMKAASRLAGLGDTYVRDVLERGREPGVEKMARLARVLGVTAADILEGDDDVAALPCMGRIGAGAEILPEYEHVPPDGLYTVELPFPVPPGLICLEVDGDSMLPRYDDGDVIVVYAEQTRPTEQFYGEEVAVRLADGRRFLKRLMRGSKRNRFNLESWNARTIEDVEVEWIGEIYMLIRAGQRRRIEATARRQATRARNARAAETQGMDELPLDASHKKVG